MPTVIPDPRPDWQKAPSVFDPTWQQTLRSVMRFLGLDDPQQQALSLMQPLSIVGGRLGAGRAALDAIRRHGFEVESFDEAAGRWLLSPGTVSDVTRATGEGMRRRAIPAAAKTALETLNALPMDDVVRLINER